MELMSSMLYLLSLCVVNVIHLTSSQSTWDVDRRENDVSSRGSSTEQALNQLITMNSQLMAALIQLQTDAAESKAVNAQLMNAVSELRSSMSQLQRDVAELKTGSPQKEATGKLVGPK